MSDRPILFSAPMIKALLSGTKTMTRRILNPQPPHRANLLRVEPGKAIFCDGDHPKNHDCSEHEYSVNLPIAVGDRLWTKETWSGAHAFRDVPPSQRESFTTPDGPVLREDVWYWADGNPTGGDYEKPRPSLFMPRYASRITLLVDDVKVERLQDISEEDAKAEGIEFCAFEKGGLGGWKCYAPEPKGQDEWSSPCNSYRTLWDRINGEGAWDRNPWVVCYRFKVVLENIDYIGRAAA